MKTASPIEVLEARIAPAAFITYLDTDGDLVKIATSKGTAALLAQGAHFTGAAGGPQQLTELDLDAATIGSTIFSGSSLSITVTHQAEATGNGTVDVGYINATGIALGVVTVKGDLAKIVVGASTDSVTVLKSLTIGSLAARGTATGAPNTASTISGPAGAIHVLGDLDGSLGVDAGANAAPGTIASLAIGGSLVGGGADHSGHVSASGLIKTITIHQDIMGGAGQSSGSILGNGGIGAITIGGSIIGGPNTLSGSISSGIGMPIGKVTVGSDLTGDPGSAQQNGIILSLGRLAGATIGGSIIGGGGASSGGIFAELGAGPVNVKGSIEGGAGTYSGALYVNGGDLTSVTVGGSLIGASASRSGAITGDGVGIGSVKIGGYLQGGGQAGSGSIEGKSIHSVSVKGKLPSGASLTGAHTLSGGIYVGSGGFGIITIAGDVLGQIESTGPGSSISIGGALGNTAVDTGTIFLGGETKLIHIADDLAGTITDSANAILDSLVVGGSLVGGSNGSVNTGAVSLSYANSALLKASIGGSVLGGSDGQSGVLYAYGGIGKVSIRHDLQGSDGSGSGEITTAGAIGSVTIGGSVIGHGHANQAGDNGVIVAVSGIDKISIAHDLQGGAGPQSGRLDGGIAGGIQSLTIGGSVIGAGGNFSGSIAGSTLGTVTIRQDLLGGGGNSSGSIRGGAALTKLSILGEVKGAAGQNSGYIGTSVGGIGTVKIGGDLSGAAGFLSGVIEAKTTLDAVTIAGAVSGGASSSTGLILTHTGGIGVVKIGGDLAGSPFNLANTSYSDIGAIESGGDITRISIGGSLRAGANFASTGSVRNDGAIIALGHIGPIAISGDIKGVFDVANDGVRNFAFIGAQGSTAEELAITSLTVGGSVGAGLIAAGYTQQGYPANADASLGPISVRGDWKESSAIAGVRNSGGSDNHDFGGANDVLISGGNAAILSSIAAITIGGHVIGSLPATDHFGFVAEQLTSLKIAGIAVTLAGGPHNDNQTVGGTTDVSVHEV